MTIDDRLGAAEKIITAGIDEKGTADLLELMGVSNFPMETLSELSLYSEYLPKASEYGYTKSQRFLHFLWDALDKSPICLNASFSIPMRRIIAKALFRRCGKNFIAEENVRSISVRPSRLAMTSFSIAVSTSTQRAPSKSVTGRGSEKMSRSLPIPIPSRITRSGHTAK